MPHNAVEDRRQTAARQISQKPVLQKIVRFILRLYLLAYHRFELEISPAIPKHGPYLALTSHFSNLDVVALMVADPYYPYSTLVVKDQLTKVPVVKWVLRWWGAIPVARLGRDLAALRNIRQVLQEGRGICIAAEGTRNPTGRLGPMNSALVRLSVDLASKGVSVFPVVEIGTYEALPKGARFPRPVKIRVVAGDPIDLSQWFSSRLNDEELLEVATLIQTRIATLLPPENRPAPNTPPIGTFRPD